MDYHEDIHLLSKDPILQSLYQSTSLNIQLIRLCLCILLLFDYYLDLIQLDYFCCCCPSQHYSLNRGYLCRVSTIWFIIGRYCTLSNSSSAVYCCSGLPALIKFPASSPGMAKALHNLGISNICVYFCK